MNQELENRALLIFNFFKNKNIGSIYLYFDKDFNDYYIITDDAIYNTEKYNVIINEYMRKYDITNIRVISKKYIISLEDLVLIAKFVYYEKTQFDELIFTDFIINRSNEKKANRIYKIDSKNKRNETIENNSDKLSLVA